MTVCGQKLYDEEE